MQSAWFKAKMQERGLSQEDIGEALGLHRSQASRIINGDQELKFREVEPLAKKLGVSPLEIIFRAWFWTEDEMISLLESWARAPQSQRRRIQRIIDASSEDSGEPPGKRGQG